MGKYMVYGIVCASVDLGTYEANSEQEAIGMAEDNQEANWNPGLCHQCSNEVEIGDVYEVKAEIVDDG